MREKERKKEGGREGGMEKERNVLRIGFNKSERGKGV
jgi:hypothetical protein